MDKKQQLIQLIQEQGILPLYFHQDEEVSIQVLKALYDSGIRAVEYTNRGTAALENFRALRTYCDKELPDMFLGIGTIKSEGQALDFVDEKADFIVCPGLVKGAAEVAERNKMLWIPGCMTPTEIIAAENMGAKIVKLFPGNLLGPGFVKAIKSLFPHLLFMPTGGVDTTEDNLTAWFNAGVCAVGMGSKLIRKDLLENKAYDEIRELTTKTIKLVHTIR